MIMRTPVFHLLFIVACMCAALTVTAGARPADAAAPKAYTISAIKSKLAGNALSMTIVGDSQPAYIVTERYSPFRVILDIANAVLPSAPENAPPLPKNDFVSYTVSTVKDQKTETTRFEFKIAESHGYKVTTQGNDIQIAITPSTGETAANTPNAPAMLTDIQVQQQSGVITVKLASTAPLTDYKTSTLPGSKDKPAAMIIDIPNVSIDKLAREKIVHSAALAKIRVAPRGSGVRVIFDATGPVLPEFVINKLDDGIQAIIKDEKPAASADMAAPPIPPEQPAAAPLTPSKQSAAAPPTAVGDATLDKLIESSS